MVYANPRDPHADLTLASAGLPPRLAAGAVVLLHGRGRSAESILSLSRSLDHPDFSYVAPQAAGRTWYPHSFLRPIEANEPAFSSGMRALGDLVSRLGHDGIPPERIVFVGFSQGGCVATEFVLRNPRRYGGLAVFIGGVFGPEGTRWDYAGGLEGTPAYLGTSDPDSWVPPERVRATAEVLERAGAEVDLRSRRDAGHDVHPEDIERTRALMLSLKGIRPPVGAVGPGPSWSAPRHRRSPGAGRPTRTPPSGR